MADVAPRIAVLVNPTSGRGRGRDAADAAIARLRELGTEVPIALVPAGTGNDFARAIGMPVGSAHAADAAELALRGEPRRIDVGRVETVAGSRHFLTVAALGFDARVSDRTNRLRWPRGRARYYLALLAELAQLRPVPFRIAVDEETARLLPGTLVAIGNTDSYGGGMPMCPKALPDDGQLDVTHVGPLSRTRLLRLFPLLLAGRHLERPEVTSMRASRVMSVEAPGLIAYADGEHVGTGAVTVTLRAGALTMLVPARSAS